LNSQEGYVQRFCLEHADETQGKGEDSISDSEAKPETLVQAQAATLNIPSDDKSRQLGDRTVYNYYFRTMGATTTVICFSLACGWAFLTTFPSKCAV
jgi:hypothetical protein